MKSLWDENQKTYEISLTSKQLGLILAGLSVAEFTTLDKEYGEIHDELRKCLDVTENK